MDACARATHVQRRRLQAQLGEGVAQGLLGGGELAQLVGQRLSQPAHLLQALAVQVEQLQPGLQVRVHGPRAPAQLLHQGLPGGLKGKGRLNGWGQGMGGVKGWVESRDGWGHVMGRAVWWACLLRWACLWRMCLLRWACLQWGGLRRYLVLGHAPPADSLQLFTGRRHVVDLNDGSTSCFLRRGGGICGPQVITTVIRVVRSVTPPGTS